MLDADERQKVADTLAVVLNDIAINHDLTGTGRPLEGALLQSWLPEYDETGKVVMRSANAPFVICGEHPKLREFRVHSVKHSFATSSESSRNMGLPGRVYQSGRAEISPDVQLYAKEQEVLGTGEATMEYPRRKVAIQCGVRCTLGLPVFLMEALSHPHQHHERLALEVVMTRTRVPWEEAIMAALLAHGLATATGTVSVAIPLDHSDLFATQSDKKRDSGLLPPDMEIDPSDIRTIRHLGVGAFGEVHLGIWKGAHVACKRLKGKIDEVPKVYLNLFLSELKMWSRLHHPNVCQFLGAVTRPGVPVTLVADYCENGSLAAVLERHFVQHTQMAYSDKLRYAYGISSGMFYLHSRKPEPVIHRDLKPANCLIDGANNIKIADFGLSRVVAAADERRGLADAYLRAGRAAAAEAAAAAAEGRPKTGAGASGPDSVAPATAGEAGDVPSAALDANRSGSGSSAGPGSGSEAGPDVPHSAQHGTMTGRTGTLKYMSPEVYRLEEYDHTCDTFSFGLMLYELFEGYFDVKDDVKFAISMAARCKPWRPPLENAWRYNVNNPGVSKLVEDLIVACWSPKPSARPSFKDVTQKLEKIIELSGADALPAAKSDPTAGQQNNAAALAAAAAAGPTAANKPEVSSSKCNTPHNAKKGADSLKHGVGGASAEGRGCCVVS